VTDPDEELNRLFQQLPSPMRPKPGRAAGIVAARRRRRSYAAAGSVAAVMIVVAGTFAVTDRGNKSSTGASPAPTSTTTAPTTTATRTPTTSSPPAIRTGTVEVGCYTRTAVRPAALKPGVLSRTTPAAATLRHFLASPGKWAEVGAVVDQLPRSQWALIFQDSGHRVFGQRTSSGLGAVLYFKLYLGSWNLDLDQCGITYSDGRAERVESAAVVGRAVDLNWSNGTCDPRQLRPLSELVRRVRVIETAKTVEISMITYENPAELAAEHSQAAALPSGSVLGCAGVGLEDHAKVTLKAPLGHRTLIDVSSVPPQVITLDGTVGTPLQ
jgi:hypothetical protein